MFQRKQRVLYALLPFIPYVARLVLTPPRIREQPYCCPLGEKSVREPPSSFHVSTSLSLLVSPLDRSHRMDCHFPRHHSSRPRPRKTTHPRRYRLPQTSMDYESHPTQRTTKTIHVAIGPENFVVGERTKPFEFHSYLHPSHGETASDFGFS